MDCHGLYYSTQCIPFKLGLFCVGSGFEWNDKTAVGFSNWAPGEPNDSDGTALCGRMFINGHEGKWDDDNCDKELYFACKRPKGGCVVT